MKECFLTLIMVSPSNLLTINLIVFLLEDFIFLAEAYLGLLMSNIIRYIDFILLIAPLFNLK